MMGVCANAQLISKYTDLTPNKRYFEIAYGTVSAYNMEAGMKYNSTHGRLIMCIGAKVTWLKEIPTYMVEQLGCSREIYSDADANGGIALTYQVFPGITMGSDDKSFVQFECDDVDDSIRMKKVVITGNTELLVKLFIYYWYRDDVKFDINKFKKGCIFYENCGSDRISFNWKAKAKPFITITQNTTFPKPIPLIAELSRK